MPFKIVRNDITKVKADIIVNTANPKPIYASGTDAAIYHAAGAEKLLTERKKIGEIARGDIAVTPAFDLKAKYIIHTVGPAWIDGKHQEFSVLESCYRKSLQKALELKCESIAFPLIATGVYGFPKDKALQIAIRVFSQFLLENDMQIFLVVFDKKSFQLSGQLMDNVDNCICNASTPPEQPVELFDLELDEIGPSFHDKLFELIDAAGMDNKDVWKKANLDRKHFSKIQCDEKYHPKKKTVMALCIALKLDLEQSKDLLARADWAFSPISKVDLIVQKAIIDKQYDIYELNLVLFKYTNEVLGV